MLPARNVPCSQPAEDTARSARGWAGGTCSLARARAVRQWARRVIERRGDDRMGAPRTHRAQRVRGHTQLQRCLWQTILGFKSWPFRLWSPITSVHPREPLSHGGIGTCLCHLKQKNRVHPLLFLAPLNAVSRPKYFFRNLQRGIT